MNRGILLMCFGSQTYGKYAYNMACSIRHCSELPLHLLCDSGSIKNLDTSVFTSYEVVEFERENIKIDNCLAKIKLFERSPFDHTIYLDVDGLCLNDPMPLFDIPTPYAQLLGMNDSPWAGQETIRHWFNIEDFPNLQTSIIAFKKSDKKFFDQLKKNYDNRLPNEYYREMWGKSKQHPDELYYGATMAQLGVIPECIQPVFFPRENKTVAEIKEYTILSMWGGNNVRSYAFDLYDRLMFKIMEARGRNHYYKARNLYKDKFINQK